MAFGASRLPLTPVDGASRSFGLGCAPLGNLFTPMAEHDADATVARALERGIRFFDTAPHYGAGISERRLGRSLATIPRDTVSIATKVGRRIVDAEGEEVPAGATGVDTVGDLTRDGILRGFEGSLRRLGTDRIDVLYLHDPEDVDEALRSALPALAELRDQGVVRAIGVGMVWSEPLTRFVREAEVDIVMIAGRVTLLDRTAEAELLPAAVQRGAGVIAAGVYNSGILADPDAAPYFDYRPASDEHLARARELRRVCAEHGLPLPHVAARYPLRRRPVEGVVVGARTPGEVDDIAEAADAVIPDTLWSDLGVA